MAVKSLDVSHTFTFHYVFHSGMKGGLIVGDTSSRLENSSEAVKTGSCSARAT